MELDDDVCLCFHVSQRKIVNFLRLQKPRRVSLLSQCGGAGTGCGWCIPTLQRLFNAANSGETVVVSAKSYAEQRQIYLQQKTPGDIPPESPEF